MDTNNPCCACDSLSYRRKRPNPQKARAPRYFGFNFETFQTSRRASLSLAPHTSTTGSATALPRLAKRLVPPPALLPPGVAFDFPSGWLPNHRTALTWPRAFPSRYLSGSASGAENATQSRSPISMVPAGHDLTSSPHHAGWRRSMMKSRPVFATKFDTIWTFKAEHSSRR
jgi:hypothetical protein